MFLLLRKRLWQAATLASVFVLCNAASCKKSTGTDAPVTPPVQPPTQPPVTYGPEVSYWLTTASKSVAFQPQPAAKFSSAATGTQTVIEIDTTQSFQPIEGFGYTLTGGSAQHLLGMGAAQRAALLKELFDTTANNIGISYLRISIGASDLNDQVFSYNDLPAGQTDPQITKFDFGPDKTTVIPVLKEILAINPAIKIMGSPWSPPVWMKDNGDTRGGSLKPEWHDAYAKYLVRYIQEMKAEGITVDAITVQNEPLHPGNNPSLLMQPEQQAAFIKTSLGPQFAAAGLATKIIIYDHNADRPDYPISILNDPDAKKYITGSAFHLYAGPIDALSQVHYAHPDKAVYFTEQWVGAPGNFAEDLKWHVRTLVIGGTRNWARTVLEWNLSSNSQLTPYTDRGGCNQCLGAVTIDGNTVVRNPAYYIIAHASKAVRPGSVRIGSGELSDLPNVAFRRPDGKYVLIVLNNSAVAKTFAIKHNGLTVPATLEGGAVGTFVW